MNIVELCNRFAVRTGLPESVTVFAGNSTLRQVAVLLDEVLDFLTTEYVFESLQREVVFTSLGQEDQGELAAMAPGFSRFARDTFFDRTQNLQILGPLTPTEWQAQKSLVTAGPYSWFRVVGGRLNLQPAPPAGHTMAFEYHSKFPVKGSGGVLKQYPNHDADTFLLPDELLLAGLRWRWKAEKGFDYAEEFRQFETLAKSQAMTSGGARAYSLDSSMPIASPGIIVPTGNWMVPS
jgi:hypothetical protein